MPLMPGSVKPILGVSLAPRRRKGVRVTMPSTCWTGYLISRCTTPNTAACIAGPPRSRSDGPRGRCSAASRRGKAACRARSCCTSCVARCSAATLPSTRSSSRPAPTMRSRVRRSPHCEGPDGLELWLGEAKFYTDRNDAIRDALKSVREHLQADYLKCDFSVITPLIDDAWPHARAVRQLIDGNMSLDRVF